MIPDHVRQTYALEGEAHRLPGGSVNTYRVGNLVLKQLHHTSLETPHSLQLAPWLSAVLASVAEDGFRISRPVPACEGRWVLADGWTAWTFIEGRPAISDDIPKVIDAARAFHRALGGVPKHPLLDQNNSPWGFAEKHSWGSRPSWVHPVLVDWVDELYAKRRLMPPLTRQLVHGDLNPENILVATGLPPGFIDLTPFWSPVDFALAIFANWIGPRQGNPAILGLFEDIAYFDQLLIRASIRMLLVMSQIGQLEDWEICSEKKAAEIVLDYVC